MTPAKKTLLIVEDDKDIRDLVAEILEENGYRVLQACDGGQGLDLLEAHPTDLILLDLMMPVVDGYQFREAQLADPRFKAIPVILMTAAGQLQTTQRPISVQDCLRKPFDVAHLLAIVRRHCP